MQRFNSVATTSDMQAQPVPQRGASRVWDIVSIAFAVSVVTLVAGGLLCFAGTGTVRTQHFRVVLFVAATPWVLSLLVLVAALAKYGIAVVELLAGKDLDGSGAVGDVDNMRLVYVRGAEKKLDGVVDPDDMRDFVYNVTATGMLSQNDWRGRSMPSGKRCSNEYHAAMKAILIKAGIIEGAGPRKTGHLTTTDASAILQQLGLLNGEQTKLAAEGG